MKTILVLVLLACILVAYWLWTPDRDRQELEHAYLAAPGDIVPLAGWRLHVRDTGPRDAPAVILIHGFGSSLQTWDGWVKGLEASHRVIRFDLPGSGLSWPDPDGDYTEARNLELLVTLMNQLGLRRASVIGHSIGGRIAWRFAAAYPDRIDKLVLVAPDGFASPGFEYGKAPRVPAALGVMRYVLPRPLLRMNLQAAYSNADMLTDRLVDRYYALILAPGARQALLSRMRQTILVAPVPLLAGMRAPTLLLWGEKDALIPFANSADYLRVIPDVRLVSYAGIGHLPQEENATASVAAVADFLKVNHDKQR